MSLLNETMERLKPLTRNCLAQAQAMLDNKTKPLGSLGRLEEFARRYVAITADPEFELGAKVIYTFAADHGVVEEGVSLSPKEVTQQMVLNFLNGGAGVNVLARHVGAEVRVVDIGVDCYFGMVPGPGGTQGGQGHAELDQRAGHDQGAGHGGYWSRDRSGR